MSSSVIWFRHFARNHAWANARLHAAVGRLSRDEYVATRTSFFPSIHQTLWHIALVDDYYLDALTAGGRGRTIFDDWDAGVARGSFDEVRALQRDVDGRIIAFVDGLTEADLARVVAIPRAHGIDRDTIGDVLMHDLTHAIHHRGQAHAMLSGTSVPPPQLDEYFLSSVDRPVADRELEAAGFAPVR